MNVGLFVVLALVLPNMYLAMEIAQDNSFRDNLVFPKDRKSNPNTRIIGGQEVTPHLYPFQAALLIDTGKGIAFCGGTLITRSVVLTAAHCVMGRPSSIMVILGAHDLMNLDSNVVVLNTTRYVYHKNWDEKSLQNDIALVRLPINVTTNANIRTVPWANGTQRYEQSASTTVGWGVTIAMDDEADISNVLRHVNTTIMTNEACAASDINFVNIIKPSHICTSGTGSKGSCNGDSGGPLLVNGVQVGIVSFGIEKCPPGKPTVYTRVTDFNDWILENLEDGGSTYENLYYSLFLSVALTIAHLFKSI